MQILRYEKGQKYDPHYDYFHDAVNSSPKRGGQRMATMLVYLRDTELGGETIFPKAKKPPDFDDPDAGAFRWSQCAQVGGVPVRSVAGDAVLFWSLTEAYTLDPGSLHGACPVVAGEKWTAVKWMRVAKFDGNFQHELPMPSLTVADRSSDDPEKNCVDEWAECAEWARKGWCARNPEFMIGRAGSRDSKGGACPKSCDVKC
jgi:prolyl 4-hydroxylase